MQKRQYSLHDAALSRMVWEDGNLTLCFQNGFVEIGKPCRPVDGYVDIRAVDWDNSRADIFSADGRKKMTQMSLTDFVAGFQRMLLHIEEERYEERKVVLSGSLSEGRDVRNCRLEIAYHGGLLYKVTRLPEWKVYFSGGFHGHDEREHAGREIAVNRHFRWDEEEWLVPSVYSCGRGLVADILCRIPAKKIQAFLDKWNLSAENEHKDFTEEQREIIDADNPLVIDIKTTLRLNGRDFTSSRSSSVCWNPCAPDHNSSLAKTALWHYGLDADDGWYIRRCFFPWEKPAPWDEPAAEAALGPHAAQRQNSMHRPAHKKHPQIQNLQLTLDSCAVAVPGPHFKLQAPGDTFTFLHPATGTTHTLTALELEDQEISLEHMAREVDDTILPNHYLQMRYSLTPELSLDHYTISDCAPSDQPWRAVHNEKEPEARHSVSVAVIGGAYGPTSIFLTTGRGSGQTHIACSSLHFQPVKDVEWRISFYRKRKDSVTVELLTG